MHHLIEKIDNFFFKGMFTGVDTYTFWYIKNQLVVKNCESFRKYTKSAQPSPHYFIDYSETFKYTKKNWEGIIILSYPAPIGKQINPEAAFQYALGLHDRYKKTGQVFFLNEFLRYSNFFLIHQDENGNWNYNFEYGLHPNPWQSALAQARGASVMLRAGQLTGDTRYFVSAEKALSKFKIDTIEGGFRKSFLDTDYYYYEEYPKQPTGVINGFMVALLGVWEVAFWTKNKTIQDLYDHGLETLKLMLPIYTKKWWTIYDLSENGNNFNSPFYHRLIIKYLTAINCISPNEIFENHLVLWKSFNKPKNIMLAIYKKSIRKILIG